MEIKNIVMEINVKNVKEFKKQQKELFEKCCGKRKSFIQRFLSRLRRRAKV